MTRLLISKFYTKSDYDCRNLLRNSFYLYILKFKLSPYFSLLRILFITMLRIRSNTSLPYNTQRTCSVRTQWKETSLD